VEEAPEDRPAEHPRHLRLVWSQRTPRALPPRAIPRSVHAPRTTPRWRVNLAVAIELHLRGDDGLSDQEFLKAFSTRP
jgi:hypothetical protein